MVRATRRSRQRSLSSAWSKGVKVGGEGRDVNTGSSWAESTVVVRGRGPDQDKPKMRVRDLTSSRWAKIGRESR
eukprot:scaffold15745_cov73-Phaeocystis_antarctica.AAC.1